MSIAKEAFRRAACEQLSDDELYPYQASQAGLRIFKPDSGRDRKD
jgi:hypothetical protein